MSDVISLYRLLTVERANEWRRFAVSPVLPVTIEIWGNAGASGIDHVSTTKSSSARSNAAHPCRKRKDGAPSVGTAHAKIVEGGPVA